MNSDILDILLVVYAVIVLINCLFSFSLYLIHREKIHRISTFLWLFSFITYFLQGLYQEKDLATVFAYSTYVVCSLLLIRVLEFSTQINYPYKSYFWFVGAMLVMMVLAGASGQSFPVVASFPALAIGLPPIHASIKTLKIGGDRMDAIFCLLLIVNSLHFLDYPVLRSDESFSLIGFSVALVNLFCFSLFLPAFSIRNITRKISEDLERQVVMRTALLEKRNEELDESNHRLQELTKEYLGLVNIICHDVATPITLINHSIDKIEKKFLTPDVEHQKVFSRLKLSADFMSEIVNSVKDLQASRSGKAVVRLEEVQVSSVLREVINLYEEKLTSKNLKLSIHERIGDDVRIVADKTILKNQILNNLFSNAVKYSFPGGTIFVELDCTSPDSVQLSIRDEGIGMPKDVLENLFKLHVPTTRRGTSGERGTGFGLPIVKTFLEKMDATLVVESHTEQESDAHGSCFRMSFKRAA